MTKQRLVALARQEHHCAMRLRKMGPSFAALAEQTQNLCRMWMRYARII